MSPSGKSRLRIALAAAAFGLAMSSLPARAQGPDWQVPRLESLISGGSSWNQGGGAYLPAGGFGGFVPYSSGPGQGLGVMSRGAMAAPRGLDGGMGMTRFGSSLEAPLGNLRPLTPIGLMGVGGMGQGQGGMPGAASATAPSRGMSGMRRPPVGSYPFRIPPSLLGPATSAPAMAM